MISPIGFIESQTVESISLFNTTIDSDRNTRYDVSDNDQKPKGTFFVYDRRMTPLYLMLNRKWNPNAMEHSAVLIQSLP